MNRRKKISKFWLLLIIPYIWDLLLIPFVNQVKIHPFGIPFLLFWMLLGVVIVTICIGTVYYFDNQAKKTAETKHY